VSDEQKDKKTSIKKSDTNLTDPTIYDEDITIEQAGLDNDKIVLFVYQLSDKSWEPCDIEKLVVPSPSASTSSPLFSSSSSSSSSSTAVKESSN